MAIGKGTLLGAAQKYLLKGQSKKAIKEYQKVIEATPKDERLHLKLGDLYLKSGETANAIEEYLKVADLYVEQDLNLKAIAIYKKVLSLDPKLIDAFHRIAELYLKEGLRGSAKNSYQSILKIKSNDQRALEALRHLESSTEQEELLEAALPSESSASDYVDFEEEEKEGKLPPPQPPDIQPPQKDPPRIAASVKKIAEERVPLPAAAVSASPAPVAPEETVQLPSEDEGASEKDGEMHYHLGVAYKEMELFDYAISEFELASSSPSIRFDCCAMLGDCFMEKGDFRKSIEYYKIASQTKGLAADKLAQLYYSLGLAYESSGMTKEARAAYQDVLSLNGSHQEAKEKIKKLETG